MKERKGITSREVGMCKGPVAGARRKEAQGGRGTGGTKRWVGPRPHRALQPH